jgi:hypothetical protein
MMMKRHHDEAVATICYLILIGLMVIGVGLALVAVYHHGEQVGAKIAMQGTYRIEEVRGSCDSDNLFTKDECVKCHDLDVYVPGDE